MHVVTAPARVLFSVENSEAQWWLPVTFLVFFLKDSDHFVFSNIMAFFLVSVYVDSQAGSALSI